MFMPNWRSKKHRKHEIEHIFLKIHMEIHIQTSEKQRQRENLERRLKKSYLKGRIRITTDFSSWIM